MARTTARITTTGPITLDVDAPAVELTVIATPGLTTEAMIDVSGPADVVDGVTTEQVGSRWSISVPAAPGSGNVTNNVVFGSVVMSAGDIHGGIVMSGGRTVVNGVEIGSGVTIINGRVVSGAKVERVYVTVQVPADSSVVIPRMTSGSADLTGRFAEVSFHGTTTALLLAGSAKAVTARTSTGDITVQGRTEQVHATSSTGDITVQRADGMTRVRTSTGDVTIAAAGPGVVTAETTTGDITVFGRDVYGVDVDARTSTGRRIVQ